MITRVESAQAWLENITYQMDHVCLFLAHLSLFLTSVTQMSYVEMSDKLAGTIALCKQYALACIISQTIACLRHVPRFITQTGRATAQDATQVFGGRGITKTGMGKLVENVSAISNSVKNQSV
jgi:alkylation response protein AidB-like acyl-CoA dehydrogenase